MCAALSRRSTPSCSMRSSTRWGSASVVTEYAWQTTSCDPCPVPPLSLDDMSTLGLDVLEGIGAAPEAPAADRARNDQARRDRAGGAASPAAAFQGRAAQLGAHAAAHALQPGDAVRGSDLPRGGVGGRRARIRWHRRRTRPRPGPSGANNFQARYIIRHYWTKPIACENPRPGSWGGPIEAPFGAAPVSPAKGLATAPRGTISLAKEVHSPVPLLGLQSQAPPRRSGR